MTTTKWKLKHLEKHQKRLKRKVEEAFHIVKRELVQMLNDDNTKVNALTMYLAQCTETDDVITFIQFLKEAIQTANKCKDDPESKVAKFICSYILFRLHLLSHFTLKWTNVEIKCNKCKNINKINFLYTNKICNFCGNIIL